MSAAMARQTAAGCARNSGALCSNRSGRVNAAPRQTRALLATQKQALVGQQRNSRQAQHGVCCRSVTEDLGVGGASQDEDLAIPVGKPDRPSITAQEEAKEPAAEAEAEEEAEDRENRGPKGKKTTRERVRGQRQEPGEVITDVPFKVGDLVQGKVLFSNFNGARVEIDCGIPGVIGYMMFNAGPHSLNQEGHHAKKSDIGPFRVPKGLVREFKILNIPDEMRENGVGPLISAKAVDEDIIWDRLDQMRNACEIDKVNFEVEITGTNKGGIRSRLQGMSLFVPYSFMPKCPEDTRWSEQVAGNIYMKKQVEVSLLDADRVEQRLVGSMNQADTNRVLKAVYPGALVMGTVRKLEGFGAFVGIDNTHMSALLHVSNVSQGHLDHVSSIFAIGDRVACIVTEMENDGTRVSISTKELEMYKGEMIEARDEVMKNADQRYAEYLQYEGYEY